MSGRGFSLRFVTCFLIVGFAVYTEQARSAEADQGREAALENNVTQGALRIVQDDGTIVECPLRHTDVKADISGFIGRVRVTQTFVNPTQEKIEAIYVFPLPHGAAVDEMTMIVGERKIVGIIKRRGEARQIYEQALAAGQTAALLEQERPNIFTQSVGNIEPGREVKIEIAYVDVLDYDMGSYEFHFPMVVGPRYHPGASIGSPQSTPANLQGRVSPPVSDTTRVPDATRISPPVLKPGYRTAHDIDLSVALDAAVPVQGLKVANHRADIQRDGSTKARVTLAGHDRVPNKDFVLRYDVVGQTPAMAVLAHTGPHSLDRNRLGEGYFMLMIQPQEDERLTKSPPREIVFLVDVSGSMSGAPTAKVVDAMQSMIGLCRPQDTLQVVTFASQANKLFPQPVPVNEDNTARALAFTQGFRGSGSTQMLEGVKLAIDEPIDEERLRIVVMLTDGYIGNEAEIIRHVGENCGDQIRFWAIGIGQSPNLFLIDGVARQGGGMGKRLGLEDDTMALTQDVMTRIQRAQLAHIQIDWGRLQVAETYPARIPELWAGRPVIVFGRYRGGGNRQISIRGTVEGEAVSWPLKVKLPKKQASHEVLAKVWARRKIESLMHSSYYAGSPAVEEEVTALALDYRLMSPYTSFVAVDTAQPPAEAARPPKRMLVPVPLPEGTRWEGFFGLQQAPMDAAKEQKGRLLGKSTSFSYGRGYAQKMPALALAPAAAPAQGFAISGAAPAVPSFVQYRFAAPSRPGSPTSLSRTGRRGGALLGGAAVRRKVVNLAAAVESQLVELDESEALLADGFSLNPSEAMGPLQTLAKAALGEAKQLQTDGKLDAARAVAERAHLLNAALTSYSMGNGEVAKQSLAFLEEIRAAQIKTWKERVPALGQQLDLILRDQTIEAALESVAAAAGLEITLTPHSVDDVRPLLQDAPRVSYLDLRHATVSQALDWILLPVRLGWRMEQGRVVASSARRRDESGWVYDVSLIATPTTEERAKSENSQQTQATGDLLAVVRRELDLQEDSSVVWFAPGQLLVFGDPQKHRRAARLLSDLADPSFQPPERLARLCDVTHRRAEQHEERFAKLQAERAMHVLAAKHDSFGWPMLAAAVDGRLDMEAFTELQMAWRRPQTSQFLESDEAAVAIRCLWILAEVARAKPDNESLQALTVSARRQAETGMDHALKTLQDDPQDEAAFVTVLYAALVRREDASFAKQALTALTAAAGENAARAKACVAARALLAKADQIDGAELRSLVKTRVMGADLLTLTALACRRAGGETWYEFRIRSKDQLDQPGLPGDVMVLVTRLSGSRLPLVAQK